MLWEKHLAPVVPDVKVLEHYNVVPELVPLNIMEDTVEQRGTDWRRQSGWD